MSSFVPPFDPAQASSPGEVRATLPDPPSTGAVVRPGVARYAATDLAFLKVTLAGGSLAAPAAGTVRLIPNVSLDGQSRTLVELSPLPFGMVPVLRGLGAAGLPTFYLWANGVTATEHAFVAAGAALASAGSGPVYVGVVFQDRVDSPPWSWIERLGAAMTAAGESVAAWNPLGALQGTAARVLAVDHAGRPLGAGAAFEVRTAPPNGPFGAPVTVTLGAGSDLAAVPGVNLFPTDGSRVEVRWKPAGTPLPVQALTETRAGTVPGGWLPLSQAALPNRRGRIQVLDADRWFAPRPADIALPRFHPGSRLEPLVDGHETYRRLVADLKASARPADAGGPFGAHLAGWAFRDFALIPGDENSHGIRLIQQILNGGGEARVLVNKMVMLKNEGAFLTNLNALAALLLVLPSFVELIPAYRRLLGDDEVGYIAQFSARFLALMVLPHLLLTGDLLNDVVEDGLRFLNAANGLEPGIALLSRHPAVIDDNPAANVPAFDLGVIKLTDLIERFATWHTKFQVVRRAADSLEPNEHIAYLGGIDINTNRMDNPGHQTAAPYHDVHARITGPAAADVFSTFAERWEFDRVAEGGTVTPALVTPLPQNLPVQPAGHVVQIGRTYFRRSAAGHPPLPFALTGEKVIHDSLLRAIRQAREYIYIEDQYFTPPSNAGTPEKPLDPENVFFDALQTAAGHCKRLIVVGPTGGGGQPFGLDRRRYLLNRLATAWGDRMIAGAPFRRPYLPPATRAASKGRCLLYENVDATSGVLRVGPRLRVPKAPFWLWIDGEVMLAREAEADGTVDGVPVSRVEVLRGGIAGAAWGVLQRPHKKGAPVTMAQIASIFVHAKMTIVDDVFVTIGSANLNRRGFFHDGEINAFAVPQALRAAADNPARRLRTLLWAEHLGLPPAMGPALLSDPIAAFDLFRRTRSEGQRLVPFNQVDIEFQLGLSESSHPALAILKGFLGLAAEIATPDIWKTLIDPTTDDDSTFANNPFAE